MMDIHLPAAALTLWQEARGEPHQGQQAVAHVIVNRLRSGKWGQTLGEVCLSEFHGIYQFSGWARGDANRKAAFRLPPNDPLLAVMAQLIYAAMNGETDPTGGATHYYAPKAIPEPSWVKGNPTNGIPAATLCGQFGNQLFYKFGAAPPADNIPVA